MRMLVIIVNVSPQAPEVVFIVSKPSKMLSDRRAKISPLLTDISGPVSGKSAENITTATLKCSITFLRDVNDEAGDIR